VLLGTLAAFATMVRRSVDGRWLRAFLLLVLGGSMFTHHVAAFYGEVLTACALFVSWTLAARGRGIASGAAVLVAVVNTPASAIGATFAAGSRANTWRRALSSLVPLAVAAGAVLAENWIRRGSPFASGYGSTHGFRTALPYSGLEGFSYPLVLGIASELLSFGKGILFFAPGLWLAFLSLRRSPPATLASVQREALLVLAGLVLVSEIARPRSRVGGLLVVLVLVLGSMWVGVSGAVFGQRGLDLCTANQYQLEALCWYVPEFSPLVRPFLGTPRLEPRMLSVFCWFGAVAELTERPYSGRRSMIAMSERGGKGRNRSTTREIGVIQSTMRICRRPKLFLPMIRPFRNQGREDTRLKRMTCFTSRPACSATWRRLASV
jgi:hypothetical protein